MSTLRRCAAFVVRHAEWWVVPACYALVVAWIYRDLWHQHGAATGLGWDTIDTHGPDLDFLSSDLREGRFSLWNPYDKGGYPVFCDPVFDRYYPFNWPFAAWGALFGTSWWLVQLKVLAHHVMAACCMHLFLRTRGCSVRASLIGGIALVASSPLLIHKASNILWPLAWVPLLWVAVDAALARPSWRRGAALGAAFLLPATAGSPPGLFYAMLLVAPYAVWRVTAARLARAPWQPRQLAICVGVAAAIAGVVLALVVLPAQQITALATREQGHDFALGGGLQFAAALRGVAVRSAGLFDTYIGAAVVLLAALAIALSPGRSPSAARRPPERGSSASVASLRGSSREGEAGAIRARFDRGLAIFLGCVAFVGIVLAAGTTTGVLPFLVDHVPGFALLRVPGRYKLLSAWSLAAAAGLGIAALEADVRSRRVALVTAGAAVVLAVILVAGWGHHGDKDRPAWWSIMAMVVPAALCVTAVLAPRRWADHARSALVLCVLVDSPLFLHVPPRALPAAELRQRHDHDAEVLARLDGVRDRFRLYDEFVLGERAGARLRVRDFRGYPALDPLSQRRYVDVLEYAKRDPAIVTDFNVRWVLIHPHFRYGWTASFVHMPSPAFVARGGDVWEAVHPAPIVAWYGTTVVEKDPRRVLAAVRATQGPDGVRRAAVVEEDMPATGEPETREGAVTSYEPDEITLTIDAPRAGLVVLNEVKFPGWHVTVDGSAAPPVVANYLLRGVWVEAGHHEITWRFDPAHWRLLVGGYVVVLAIIAAAAGAAASAAWRRRAARAGQAA
jgi:hypothetical protein